MDGPHYDDVYSPYNVCSLLCPFQSIIYYSTNTKGIQLQNIAAECPQGVTDTYLLVVQTQTIRALHSLHYVVLAQQFDLY